MAVSRARVWSAIVFCAASISCGDEPTKPAPVIDPHSGTWDLVLNLETYYSAKVDEKGAHYTASEVRITLSGSFVVPIVPVQDSSTKSLKVTGLVDRAICPGACASLSSIVWDTGAWGTNYYGVIYLGQKAHGGYGTWVHLTPHQAVVRDSLSGDAHLAFGTGRSIPYHTGTFVATKRR
jgi:hypothetical protein